MRYRPVTIDQKPMSRVDRRNPNDNARQRHRSAPCRRIREVTGVQKELCPPKHTVQNWQHVASCNKISRWPLRETADAEALSYIVTIWGRRTSRNALLEPSNAVKSDIRWQIPGSAFFVHCTLFRFPGWAQRGKHTTLPLVGVGWLPWRMSCKRC